MTSTEQREMTAGRELDALVEVKIFGRIVEWIGGDPFYVTHEGGWRGSTRIKHRSTDIAAAWAILEHLEADPRRILSEITRKTSSLTNRWVYEVVLRQCTPPFPPHWVAEADTAPLAVSLAALKAVDSFSLGSGEGE